MTDRPAPEPAPAVIEQAKRGDKRAFEAIVRHYDPGLRALAYRLLGDTQRMDDALQDAYLRAFRALPRFRGESKLSTWVYRIAYNACMDELHSSRRIVHFPLETLNERADPAPGVGESVMGRADLGQALASLSPEDRAAVLMVDAQGFAYRDAAQAIGVPEGTIASRLNRARAILRTALEDRVEGVSER